MRILSGIQPSGRQHIGNYIGAIKLWVDMLAQQEANIESFFMIADLHAITVPQEAAELKQNVLDLVAWYMAAGLDPKKSTFFVQSQNADHPYLAWIFDCITPMGWMERMTQYKDKSAKQGERTSVGLFHYPSLMAADILLYQADMVPVGDDQQQHIEITRDIAERFNKIYGQTFTIPRGKYVESGKRIMSLQNPLQKMSKSDANQSGTVYLDDPADFIAKKIQRAVTDSGNEILYSDTKPALKNLIDIYSVFAQKDVKEVEALYKDKTYAQFKADLAEVVISVLAPLHNKYTDIMTNPTMINSTLATGLQAAQAVSSRTIQQVKQKVGFMA